jgi:hypothetical protein
MKNIITFSPNKNKNIFFTDIINKSQELVNKLDPIKNINNYISTSISKNKNFLTNQTELLNYRVYQLTKYKLSLFLNREIQQEIFLRGNLISNKLNNEIVSENFSFHEDKTNDMFLHKRVDDFFIIIHFRYMKPNVDKKYITQMKNESTENYYKKFGDDMGIFRNLTGADHNSDFLEANRENLHSQGVQHVEEYYPDYTPFNFNINILNSDSEMLQYVCYSQENEVLINLNFIFQLIKLGFIIQML